MRSSRGCAARAALPRNSSRASDCLGMCVRAWASCARRTSSRSSRASRTIRRSTRASRASSRPPKPGSFATASRSSSFVRLRLRVAGGRCACSSQARAVGASPCRSRSRSRRPAAARRWWCSTEIPRSSRVRSDSRACMCAVAFPTGRSGFCRATEMRASQIRRSAARCCCMSATSRASAAGLSRIRCGSTSCSFATSRST